MPDTATAPATETLGPSGVTPTPAGPPAVRPGTPGGGTHPSSSPSTKEHLKAIFSKAADRDSTGRQVQKTSPPQPKPQEKPKPVAPVASPESTDPEDPEFEAGEPTGEPEDPETSDTPSGEPTPDKGTQEPPKGKGKGPDPWKLVNTYKGKLKELERDLAETRAKVADPELVTKLSKRAEAAEARLKELDSEMRYVDYTKSTEFMEKHEVPYQRAWKAAGKVINELTVANSDGTTRPATLQDMVELANLPLAKAYERAVEKFGDLASTVMTHREKIVELAELREEDLANARKQATERDERQQQTDLQLRHETAEVFTRINEEQIQKQDFLRPREGDTEFNARLEKARAFVENAFSANLRDPKLTKDQRAQIIQRMVTVRNRAVGFSALRLDNKRLTAELAAAKKALAEYNSSEPGKGDGKKDPGTAQLDPRSRLEQAIRGAADRTTWR